MKESKLRGLVGVALYGLGFAMFLGGSAGALDSQNRLNEITNNRNLSKDNVSCRQYEQSRGRFGYSTSAVCASILLMSVAPIIGGREMEEVLN